jgi:hypothetical protein
MNRTANDTLFIDVGYTNRRKYSENVSGDAFVSRRLENEGRLVAVLSDGLGSGIKANILATMTAEMALRFAVAGSDLLRSSEVMMEALPVCQVRKIAYATFTIIDCDQEGNARVVEEGNPACQVYQAGVRQEAGHRVLTSRRFPERSVNLLELRLQAGDRLVVCSDGVTQAGMGTLSYPLGWRDEGLSDFLAGKLRENPDISSRDLSQAVVEEAISIEPGGEPHDDTSCLTLYFRQPRRLLVLTGPPFNSERDAEYAAIFDSFPGRKAISGGTTAELVARELGATLEMESSSFRQSSDVPPYFTMDGTDLVTEGILTLTQVARRLDEPGLPPVGDGAGRLLELLLDSDSIKFMVGTRINEAHQDPSLPKDLEIRRNVIKRIATSLKERYLKDVEQEFI